MAEEDLIYGKNRHLFGGIEPSNMLYFKGDVGEDGIQITATLPNDTIINGQTLCTVGGAVIRRKTTEYPKDEFDGDLVADIKNSASFLDSTASKNGTYYYSAFPYSAQGVYNRNKANHIVVNEPEPMKTFSGKFVLDATTESFKIEITAELPDRTVGAVIRKSTTGYPANEADGEEFKTITANGVYTDGDVSIGTIYYYAAFPYTSTGAYNRSEKNRIMITKNGSQGYLFGYDLSLKASDPKERVTYPTDVDNAGYTPAYMDFENNIFNYGGWQINPGEKFMPRPCMLTKSGVVSYYLDPYDYSKKVDGTNSDVANTNFLGNAMMEWPKIYTKRWEENNTYHFRCSDVPQDDDWDCWCNYDKNNNQIDNFYTAIYYGSKSYMPDTPVTNFLRSISGQDPCVNYTPSKEIEFATANGDDWYTEVLADRLLIQDLLVMMGKSTELQSVFGNGNVASVGGNTIQSGSMNSKGLFWGNDSRNNGVKVFGMENLWGNLWRRIAGWINDRNTIKIKITYGTHDGTTASYNINGDGYIGINSAMSGTSGGYISEMVSTVWGRFPKVMNGASNTYEGDSAWFETSAKTYALVGGSYGYYYPVGPFCVDLAKSITWAGASGGVANSPGTALSCKPSASN